MVGVMKTCGEIEDKKPFERYVKRKLNSTLKSIKLFFLCVRAFIV